ncbi:uncharacterized protein PGTG_22260 [Puccinia graminis f. sp. tritici CRL 75-36-700-3]|uniref:Tyr recombinase domain-containing protein n=1 Tax=Puccinia graminis f. sp. tritici (strain CRL 75-36-700-3 / race SCCL) TaxID=418459 RepID=H6QU34_PUCGT|nr:uncharacterized protein PGTG_22260 [Puccinia graminis f. sp. tritici CRL 75-36-700-3]EHS64446.1 hypothetical protein PGTG_22260 [Puccinia graminis f. sp. tritici CRL 75-36-700-3]
MNVDKWRDALGANHLLPEYQDVIDGFTHGFDQGIPQHTIEKKRWFTPDNHKSSLLAKDKIQESIAKELAAGRMKGPFSHHQMEATFGFFRSNPLGAVVNGDGKIRPINDLSYPRNDTDVKSVNSYVNKLDFETTWDDFKTVSKFFAEDRRKFELALFDWEGAYRQIPTRRDQWKYLLVQDFDGNLLIDTRITFGGVAGCGSFGHPADAWKLIMKNHFDLVTVFRWVDDNLFVKEIGVDLPMKDIVLKSTELGVMTNIKKFSDFSTEQKFIGFVWDGVNKTVRLPEGKIEKRLSQIYPFQVPKASFDYEDAEVPSVLFISLVKIVDLEESKRPTPVDVLEDLQIWVETLGNFEHTRLIRWGPPLDVGWVGDASTSFGIGILIGKHWAQFKLVDPHSNKKRISLLETIAIRLGLIMLLKLRDQRGKSLIVWTDNTTTENSINNMKTKDKDANDEWKKIQKILLTESVNLIARRVTSKDNKADALSRGLRSGQPVKHQVVIQVPSDLQDLSTLKSYNSAVRKFLAFKKAQGLPTFLLPATEDDIYEFCYWAGKTDVDGGESGVLAVTLKKYLQGLKAWHIFHDSPYPVISERKAALLLKSSLKVETLTPKKEPKKPVLIKHLVTLANDLSSGSLEDSAILDLALVAFWSLARLGELTTDQATPRRKILKSHVSIDSAGTSATIELKQSKTALPGESQFLQLKGMPNILCPVRALTRRLATCGQSNHLFGYRNGDSHVSLTKYFVRKRLAAVWAAHGFTGLSGHSFRVGGASFHNAVGIAPAQICKVGRWASASYKLYIRDYSENDLLISLQLLARLDLQWRLS